MPIPIQPHETSIFLQPNPLQRMSREVNVATRHGMVTEMFDYRLYAKALIGSDEHLRFVPASSETGT